MDRRRPATDASETGFFFEKLKWLTSKEAAILLRTSAGQVRNLVWSGKLKAYHFGNRLRFTRADCEKLLVPAF